MIGHLLWAGNVILLVSGHFCMLLLIGLLREQALGAQ